MATKKSISLLIGTVIVTAWLMGFVVAARTETMKCRTAGVQTKREAMALEDEGHALGLSNREGLAFFENGEIADFKVPTIFDAISGKGLRAIGYYFFRFEDGSTIVTTLDQKSVADSTGKLSSTMTGEIIKGSGRFEGIKGTVSFTGKQFPNVKGEANKSSNDIIFIYTLPSK